MKKIIWAIIIILVLAGGCWYGSQVWWPKKQLKIQLGLAEPDFPWWDYTQEELDKLYPQIRYADVPTRVTPEETYAKFREALRTNNLELALEQFYDGNRTGVEATNSMRQFYEEDKFRELYNHYPANLEKVNMYESIAQYEYTYFSSQYDQELIGTIDFVKDANGDWKMDSL